MNHNTATWSKLAASVFFCGLAASSVSGQSSDALLNKLVSKGVLTAEEAKALSKDAVAVKVEPNKLSLPAWLSNLKISGDFRGRYDGTFEHNDNFAPTSSTDASNANANQDRNRLRYRLRLGLTATLSDHFEVGMRLSSGDIGTVAAGTPNAGAGSVNAASPIGGSATSANTTMNNNASRKFIFVDLAYAKWTPAKWVQAEFGKMNNAFWFTDMVFDPDYNPEG